MVADILTIPDVRKFLLPAPHSCAVEWESEHAYGWTITVLRHPPEPELKFCPSCGEDLTKPPVETFDV